MTKVCSSCREEKPITAFRARGGKMAHLLKSQCNTCLYKEHKKWTSDNPDRLREYRDKDRWTLVKRCSRRGITPEQLVDTYDRQEERCAICKKSIALSDSAIDHNHATGEFRGVLCKQCNLALGMFKDSPTIIRNAGAYLEMFGDYSNDLS